MRSPPLHGAAGRHQRLADHLPAENPLPSGPGAATAKQIALELFEVEYRHEIVESGRLRFWVLLTGHRKAFRKCLATNHLRHCGRRPRLRRLPQCRRHRVACLRKRQARETAGVSGMAENKARRKRGSDKRANGIRKPTAARRHVLIAGSGIAGLSLALALARACPTQLTVTVCDPALPAPGMPDARADDERAYAVAAAGRRMFEALGIWPQVAGEAQPMRDMVITDSHLADPVRPAFLNFDGEIAPGEAFAHMVPARALL